jgi:hypothetical protein
LLLRDHHIALYLTKSSPVTLPEGVKPGDTIHVQAPDGRLNAIVVPPGMYPGSTFTVQFADGPPPAAPSAHNPPVAPSTKLEPEVDLNIQPAVSPAHVQDDFVAGFGSQNNRRY